MTNTTATDTKRLFIATPITNPDVMDDIQAIRQRILGILPDVDFRWEERPHVTIRYIGEANLDDQATADEVTKLREGLWTLADRALEFKFTLADLDTFPGVLWQSLKGSDMEMKRLSYLFKRVDRLVRSCSFPAADYSPTPHITVGRYPQELEMLVRAAAWEAGSGSEGETGSPVVLEGMALMESVRERGEDGDWKVEYRPAFENGSVWEFGK